MKKLLRRVLVVLVVVAVLFGVASAIHWFRERALRHWAEGLGGTFESGGLLGYVDVPEAAPFDPGHADVTVRHYAVARVARGDERYVLAMCDRVYRRSREDPRDHVVVLVTWPGAELPEVNVFPQMSGTALAPASELGTIEPPPLLALPETVPGFPAEFRVEALSGAAAPDEASLGRFLPPPVQEDLLASREFCSGLAARGDTARFQAVAFRVKRPYREMLALAQRAVDAWRGR